VSCMFELLQQVRRECDEQGLGASELLLLACRTFAQQIGALPPAAEAAAAASDGSSGGGGGGGLVAELTLCGMRYLQGWLQQNEPPLSLPEVAMQAILATCGWDWLAGSFDDGAPPSATTVADAFSRMADAIEGQSRGGGGRAKQCQSRRGGGGSGGGSGGSGRSGSSGSGAAASLASASSSAAQTDVGAADGAAAPPPALPSRSFAPEVTVDFNLAVFARAFRRAAAQDPSALVPPPASSGAVDADSTLPSGGTGGAGGGAGGGASTVPDAGCLDRATRAAAAEVEGELHRVLPRAAFEAMEPLGQFNLGFIVARSAGELFIVDQHAADEKHRFETLRSSTEIHTQRLIAPLPLQLTAADELVVLDHLHVFKRNGFDVEVVDGAPPTQRLRLRTLPFSKHTVFGPSDVLELVTLLAEVPGQHVALPKLRAVFAMRACRSAVMIGTALEPTKMRTVVSQLARLDQPWNCPHGRPTLRHLVSLDALAQQAASKAFGGGRGSRSRE